MVIVSFSISSVCILVILLILWVTLVWGSATAQSPSGKTLNPLTLPLRRCRFFSGVVPWHKNFTLSCVISLWDSATAHSSSGKEFNPSFQEDARLFSRYTLAYKFHFILHHPSLGLSNGSLTFM